MEGTASWDPVQIHIHIRCHASEYEVQRLGHALELFDFAPVGGLKNLSLCTPLVPENPGHQLLIYPHLQMAHIVGAILKDAGGLAHCHFGHQMHERFVGMKF